jgi:FG-GAP-like repeat
MALSFRDGVQSPFQASQKAYVVDLETGDFNQDAQVDLVMIRYDYEQRYLYGLKGDEPIIEILQGKGNGEFNPGKVSPLGISLARAYIAKTADFNQDGKLDLLVSGAEVQKAADGSPVSSSQSQGV